MRTTVTIDDDVLAVARVLALRDGSSLGSVLSTLARRGFRRAEIDDDDEDDVPTFRVAPESAPITSEDVRKALSDWP
ncbi:MAG: hypothetical protein OXJ62_16640 [Spirochaetaceae bacterium]|nr:hypothetical protein [Spirochaetaceae bacterium]